MISKVLNNFNKKRQSRNKRKNIQENWYLDANILTDNSIEHVSQSKKMRKSDCFTQEDDPNFFTIPESRNSKSGIMYCYSEND